MAQAQWKRDICDTCCEEGCIPYVPCCIRSMFIEYRLFAAEDDEFGIGAQHYVTSRMTLTNETSAIEGPDWSWLQSLSSGPFAGPQDNVAIFGSIPYSGCTFGVPIDLEHLYCPTPGGANFTVKVTVANGNINRENGPDHPIWVQPQDQGSFSVTFDEIGDVIFPPITPILTPVIIQPGQEHEFIIQFGNLNWRDVTPPLCVEDSSVPIIVQPHTHGGGRYTQWCRAPINCDKDLTGDPPWTGATSTTCENLSDCPVCDCVVDNPVNPPP